MAAKMATGSGTPAGAKRFELVAGPHAQLLMAELIWSLVGGGLLTLGLYWILHHFGPRGIEFAAPALAVGVAKSLLVLDGVARKALVRIEARGERSFAFGFFSGRSWLLIAGMMLLGQTLRLSPIPRFDLGIVYVAVGSALLVSSRVLWRAWLDRSPAGSI
jgi:hypothetical protein